MGVPGESVVGRRELERPRLAALSIVAFALLIYLYGPWLSPRVAAPSATDCVELHLYSNGFHSDIGAPAAIFPETHPLRRLYPDATSFLIGWGDERFYRSEVFNVWLGVDAMVPPSPSVMHVAYNAAPSSIYLGSGVEDVPAPVSREGAGRFVAYVDRTLALDAAGAAIAVAPGKIIGRSSFLRARGSFHLFNVCNQWMARALRAAGLDINARATWFGAGLVRAVRRARPVGCPQSPGTPSRPI